jgi:transposase
MSRPMADTPKRRPRRQFTDEFKAGAVRLVLDEGKTVGAAARDLDLTETALREWVRRAQADRTRGRTGLTTAERDELARLRKENKVRLDCGGKGRLRRRRLWLGAAPSRKPLATASCAQQTVSHTYTNTGPASHGALRSGAPITKANGP